VILLILVILLSILLKKCRYKIRISERAWDINREIVSQLDKERQLTSYQALSVKNLINMVNYNCPDDCVKYTYVCELPEGQHIGIIFEIEREYSQETQISLKEKNLPHLRSSRYVECTVFVDGDKKDPILLKKLFSNSDSIEIDVINCMDCRGRGIGTLVVQKLAETLKSYDIKKIRAKMSMVDYKNKDKLYNFYINKNGFKLVNELTEDKWGLVVKDLL
jgi:hypothetical protein